MNVRYLYQPGELEGGAKRATDPFQSFKICTLESAATKPDEPVIYYLRDGSKRGFARQELAVGCAPEYTSSASSVYIT